MIGVYFNSLLIGSGCRFRGDREAGIRLTQNALHQSLSGLQDAWLAERAEGRRRELVWPKGRNELAVAQLDKVVISPKMSSFNIHYRILQKPLALVEYDKLNGLYTKE